MNAFAADGAESLEPEEQRVFSRRERRVPVESVAAGLSRSRAAIADDGFARQRDRDAGKNGARSVGDLAADGTGRGADRLTGRQERLQQDANGE